MAKPPQPDKPVTIEIPGSDGKFDPEVEGQRTGTELGLEYTYQINNPTAAVAVQGVANYRFMDKEGQRIVMETIAKVASPELQGELRRKIADMKTQPEWTPRSMTDDELRSAVVRNDYWAKKLGDISGVTGKVTSIGFGYYGDLFQKSADRMREELLRRIDRGEHH